MSAAVQTLEAFFVVLVGLVAIYVFAGCAPPKPPCSVSTEELAAKLLECRARVDAECPNYVRGTCSTDRGAVCEECPAVTICHRWIESVCE